MKSQASRLVLVMLLGIAFFEMGITKRFGQIWNLAFQPTPKAPANSSSTGVQIGPITVGPTQPGTPDSGNPITGTSGNFD